MSELEPKVSCSIDFEADGKQFGHLGIPHSRNDSGWGAVHLPIVCIKNGGGKTILYTGGNHGDEYEGPISLMKLARGLDPAEVQGRVIIIPCLNYPAVLGGARVSPIDGVNMNRAFPGVRDGTVSQMIAHFVQHKILPISDVVNDIHSGGKTMYFAPFACYHWLENASVMEAARQAMLSFAAPISLQLVELDAAGMLDTAVEEMDKIFVGTELGGGGTTTPETMTIADRGVRNLLAHFDIIGEEPVTREALGLPPTRNMDMPDGDCFIISQDEGIYEALVELNSDVKAGDAIGQIHFPKKPELAPAVYHAKRPGTVIGRTHKALVTEGDFLGMIGVDVT